MGATMQRRKACAAIAGQILNWEADLVASDTAKKCIKVRVPRRSVRERWFPLWSNQCCGKAASRPLAAPFGSTAPLFFAAGRSFRLRLIQCKYPSGNRNCGICWGDSRNLCTRLSNQDKRNRHCPIVSGPAAPLSLQCVSRRSLGHHQIQAKSGSQDCLATTFAGATFYRVQTDDCFKVIPCIASETYR